MKNKNILVDAHTFDENHQGIRTFLKGLYGNLDIDSSNLKIYLAANDIDNLKEEFKNQPHFNYIKLNSQNKYIRLVYELPKIIRAYNIDIAHFNYYLPLILNKKCKYMVTIHDVLFIDFPEYFPLKYRLINTYLFKRSALKADILTTVSNYSSKQIKNHFKIPNKQITILPNAISDKYKKEYNKTHHQEYIRNKFNIEQFIVYVSRIEPRKNHYKLVKAYEELKLWEKGISLVLIGKESFADNKLMELIDKVNISSNRMIYKLHDIDSNDLIKFYNAAILAVFPSLCEGFGIPPIESAVLKTPTICSNSTAMKDFTFFEDCFFDATNVELIKNKISNALFEQNDINDIEKLQRISDAIKIKYNWKNTAKTLKHLILNE